MLIDCLYSISNILIQIDDIAMHSANGHLVLNFSLSLCRLGNASHGLTVYGRYTGVMTVQTKEAWKLDWPGIM